MTIKIIRNLISAENIKLIEDQLVNIEWEDGKETAQGAAKGIKSNLQCLKPSAPLNVINQIILDAFSKNVFVQNVIIPVNVLYPFLNSYENGGFYGQHIDRPIRYLEKSKKFSRSDLSVTVFLNDVYEGGELVIYDGDSSTAVKLNKGDAVIYPSGHLHEVKPVTSGKRICAVSWIQSGIKDGNKREVIYDLLKLGNKLSKSDIETQNLVSKIRNNLTREWFKS